MFKSIGFASALIVSSLLVAPFAMAEESQAFVARNEAIHANFEQHEEALAAQAREHDKTQQASPITLKWRMPNTPDLYVLSLFCPLFHVVVSSCSASLLPAWGLKAPNFSRCPPAAFF